MVNLLEAVAYAQSIGLPLNRHMTVSWELAGVEDDLAATGFLLKQVGEVIRNNGGDTAYVWVREVGETLGNHVHILHHLPPSLCGHVNRRTRRMMARCGARWEKGVRYSRPIGRSLRHAERTVEGGERYGDHLDWIAAYVSKAAKPETLTSLGLWRAHAGGVVIGKRCATSQNIGAKARLTLDTS